MSDLETANIERSLAKDREDLARTLAQLRTRFAPTVLIAEGRELMQSQALPVLSHVDKTMRASPLTTALAGLVLTAFVLGRRKKSLDKSNVTDLSGSPLSERISAALMRREDEGVPPQPEPAFAEEEWLREAIRLHAHAASLLARIENATNQRLAPAEQLASYRAEITTALARDIARTIGRGLEPLTGAALEAAVKAREKAIIDSLAMPVQASAPIPEQPLGSAIAIALAGAAVALVVPHSKAENRLLAEVRDSLLDDIFRSARDEALGMSELARTLAAALQVDLATLGAAIAPSRSEKAKDG